MQKIMFNERYGLQQATFNETKTMTRRVVPDKIMKDALAYQSHHINDEKAYEKYILDHAPYKVGEVVAIAQRYSQIISAITPRFAPHAKDWMRSEKGWDNKMFVKAKWMPHHIEIKSRRLEHLQDISDEDCLREGIMEGEFMNTWDRYYYDHWGDCPNHITFRTPRAAYASLIDKVGKRGTWDNNPLVFAYEYERLD